MREARLREALIDARVPDERAARERGWRLVREAYTSSPPPIRPRRGAGGRRALQVAIAVGLIAALISPAGAAVRDWVGDAVETGHEPSLPALTSLPAPGSLLVDSPRGQWVVHEDGSKRLLGDYRQSTWSPRGLFVAATGANELAALDPLGDVRWTLGRGGSVSDPAWSPDGERVAYLSSGNLRVVAGDGTGDRLLERSVAPVAPAWRPGGGRVLSFVTKAGGIRTVRADTGRVVFEAGPGLDPFRLEWSANGERLLAASRSGLVAIGRDGTPVWSADAPAGMEIVSSAISPTGARAATVLSSRSGEHSELVLLGPGHDPVPFVGPGRFDEVVYSPDGEWLLLTWPTADQWLFLNPRDPRQIVAISEISAQFAPGATSPSAFPEVEGWCCRDPRDL
jgi:hypothetical protein